MISDIHLVQKRSGFSCFTVYKLQKGLKIIHRCYGIHANLCWHYSQCNAIWANVKAFEAKNNLHGMGKIDEIIRARPVVQSYMNINTNSNMYFVEDSGRDCLFFASDHIWQIFYCFKAAINTDQMKVYYSISASAHIGSLLSTYVHPNSGDHWLGTFRWSVIQFQAPQC